MANLTSVTKHFPKPKEGFITTLSSTIASGAATVPLTSVSGLTNGDVFVGLVEPGLANEQCFTGTVDTAGTQITGVVWTKGTNIGHNAGVTVVDYVTSTTVGMISKGVLVEHRQDGTHDISQIVDDNGLEKLKFTETASAVNEFTIANAATGNAPEIQATGGDTDINVKITPKGTGILELGGYSGTWQSWSPSYTNLTVGDGTVVAKYCQIGKTIHARWSLLLGGTSSVSNGATISLPLAANSGYIDNQPIGTNFARDVGTASYFGVMVVSASGATTTMNWVSSTAGTSAQQSNTTFPFTEIANDYVSFSVTYEVA